MKFTKLLGEWHDPQLRYTIRETCGTFYIYEGLRYVGSRPTFDAAQELAREDVKK